MCRSLNRKHGLVLYLLAVLVAGCARPTEAVRVTGASTVYPIIQMAGERLHATRGLRVVAQTGGSTRGFEDTIAGRNDFGAMARDLTEEESSQVIAHPIAYDGVGVVVHRTNPVTGLTTQDLRDIYLKRKRSWSAYGWKNAEIVAVSKAEGHATLEVFLKHTGLDRRDAADHTDVVAGDNAQVIRVVANTPDAIGYVSMGEVMHAAANEMDIKLVSLDGVSPLLERVADGSYPLRRTLYLVSLQEPVGAARALLDFLKSPDGRKVIVEGKYVPISP